MRFDRFARELTESVRDQADRRILRNVRQADTGVVLSTSPLRIQPRRSTVDRIVYEAEDIAVVSGVPLLQGQTVTLFKTVSDDLIAVPVLRGTDLDLAPMGAGLPASTSSPAYPGAGDPNDTVVTSGGGPNGLRVINKALSYVGTKEKVTNGDLGGKIDEWISRWGLTPGSSDSPWCGCFADAMFKEAGVDDQGFGDPYTGDITARAKAANRHFTNKLVMGMFAVNGTQHVTLYIRGPANAAECVGGNQSNAVTKVTYDIRGWDYCIPLALEQGVASTTGIVGGATPGTNNTPTAGSQDDWL